MPFSINHTPFLKDQCMFQQSLMRSHTKKRKLKKPKCVPIKFSNTQTVATYPLIDEVKFYQLVSGQSKAVVNFSEGDGFETILFHMYLKVLSCEHGEAVFAYIDTEKSPELKKKLGIESSPTLVVIAEGHVKDIVTGFKDFKDKVVVDLPALKARLASSSVIHHGGIIPEKPNDIDQEYIRKVTKAKLLKVQRRLRGSSDNVNLS